jgi:hypothetical protein
VPWCETCSKYLTPTGLAVDGSCPTCGRTVAEAEQQAQDDTVVADERTPWHFKLLIGAVAIYLIWRLIQMIGWLF